MRFFAAPLFSAALLVVTSGCAVFSSGDHGALYEDVTLPLQVVAARPIGPKTGKACAQTYLGLIAMGDSGLQAAALSAGISEISTVDFKRTSILGLFVERCTIITGK